MLSTNSSVFKRINSNVKKVAINASCKPQIYKMEKNNAKNSIKKCLLDVIGKEPIHIDKIIGSLNIDRIALFELLFEMQNENEIICLPGNYYVKIS